MVRQLEHHKGKKYVKGRGVSLARGIPAEAAPAEKEEATAEKKIVRTKRFLIHPMTESEAIDQMEILDPISSSSSMPAKKSSRCFIGARTGITAS